MMQSIDILGIARWLRLQPEDMEFEKMSPETCIVSKYVYDMVRPCINSMFHIVVTTGPFETRVTIYPLGKQILYKHSKDTTMLVGLFDTMPTWRPTVGEVIKLIDYMAINHNYVDHLSTELSLVV